MSTRKDVNNIWDHLFEREYPAYQTPSSPAPAHLIHIRAHALSQRTRRRTLLRLIREAMFHLRWSQHCFAAACEIAEHPESHPDPEVIDIFLEKSFAEADKAHAIGDDIEGIMAARRH